MSTRRRVEDQGTLELLLNSPRGASTSVRGGVSVLGEAHTGTGVAGGLAGGPVQSCTPTGSCPIGWVTS